MNDAGDQFGIDIGRCQTMNISGAIIQVDESFFSILHLASLKKLDLKTAATACLCQLDRLDLLHNRGATLLHGGDTSIQGDAKQPFLFGAVSPVEVNEHLVTGVVFAVHDEVAGIVTDIERGCSRLRGKQRRRTAKEMTRADIGIRLTHELAHAFGTQQSAPRCLGLSISDLELLTDALAFLACGNIFGEASYLGAGYLCDDVKERGEQVTHETVGVAAKRVLVDLGVSTPPPK